MLYSLYIDNKMVDVSSGLDVSLTYTSIDLASPEAIKNSFSKSIILKGTPNNNQIFGSIYKLDRSTINEEDVYTGVYFDARKRTPFVLYYNGDLIESGYFQLDEISIQNHNINYSITLYGELGNFFYNLKYNEDGEERKLYDLTFADEEEFNDRSKNKWDSDFILTGWKKLGLDLNTVPIDYQSKLNEHIVAAPTYSGYYDGDFDNNKVAVNLTNLNPELKSIINDATAADGTKHSNYSPQNDWSIIEAPRDLDEWEVKDLRCKYQRPAYKTKWVLDAISDPANNGGYTIQWDEDVINSPYYKDSFVLRSRLTNDADDDLSSANYLQFDMGGNSIKAINHLINTKNYALMNSDGSTTIQYDSKRNCLVNSFVIKIETPQLDKSTKFLTCWERNLWDIGPYSYSTGPFCSRNIICVSGIELTISIFNQTKNKYINRTVFLYSNLKPGQYGYNQTFVFESFLDYVLSNYDSAENILLTKVDKNHSEWYFNDVYYINDSTWKDGDSIMVYISAVSKRYMAQTDGLTYSPLTFNSDEPINNILYIDPVLGKRVYYGGVSLRNGSTDRYTIINTARIRDNKSIVLSNNTSFQSGFMDDYLNENNEFVLSKRKLFNNDDLTPFDFLTSFTKMLNLKYLPDIATKTINILPFNKFYQNKIIDLNDRIDRGQEITINPNVSEHLQYRWQLAENENYANDIIRKTYGINEGEYIKNTGYQFSRDTSEVLNDILFKNANLYLQNSIFYTKLPLNNPNYYPYYFPAILLSPTYKQTFYKNADLDSLEVDKIGKGGNFDSPLFRQSDSFPKLCCFDKDNNEVEDLDLIMVFFDGAFKTGKNEYILTENIQTIIKMNDYKNLHIYSNSENYISDFTNDSLKIHFLNQIPKFTKSLNYKYLIDFNQPIHSFVGDSNNYQVKDNLYGRFWQNYIDDLYSVDNKKITLKCFLPDKPYDALRCFYFFNNSLWFLNEITDYEPARSEPVECTFIRVNDIENYIGSFYSEPVNSRPFNTTPEPLTTEEPTSTTTSEPTTPEPIDLPVEHAKPNYGHSTSTLESVVDEYMKGLL